MIKATTFEGMVKTVAHFLDLHSGIDQNRIINKDSVRGADLAEMISSDESYSPSASSAFMLFEFVENPDNDFISPGETVSKMENIQTYDLHMLIYGNGSPSAAQRVSAMFKRPELALALREEGVFVNGVAPIEPQNEFLNDTWVLRRDVFVRMQIRIEIEDSSVDPGVFDETQSIAAVVVNAAKL